MEIERSFFRDKALSEQLVFVDGISGSGKSMIAPLLSSLKSSELWMIDHIFEFSLIMHSLGHISCDATKTLINTYADLNCYNLMIGRNVNYRATDDSSVQKNKLKSLYDKRRDDPDGPIIEKIIRNTKPINIFMTHYIFYESKPLFEALGDRLKIFIIPVRHPYFLVEHWFNQDWDQRMPNDIRDSSLQYRYKEKEYIWHVKGWEEIYDSLSKSERAIETIYRLSINQEKIEKNFTADEIKRMMIIPFEQFAVNPVNFFEKISHILKTKETKETKEVMKINNVPRNFEKNFIDQQKEKLEYIFSKEDISSEFQKKLHLMAEEYESKYLKEVL